MNRSQLFNQDRLGSRGMTNNTCYQKDLLCLMCRPPRVGRDQKYTSLFWIRYITRWEGSQLVLQFTIQSM